ncbi:nucleoprotein [Hainan oriental leaf-toed gecko hantavirus]|uniref:Nucleoprotein n=1 Tax=Hainan oriental leaf-toed gecko hantavirus TaxID=2116437 RepID=A0A2P1GNS0_9VIRU|nr:nucleoprotein [Hainan oriental leaf-toed gecko hantavirus]
MDTSSEKKKIQERLRRVSDELAVREAELTKARSLLDRAKDAYTDETDAAGAELVAKREDNIKEVTMAIDLLKKEQMRETKRLADMSTDQPRRPNPSRKAIGDPMVDPSSLAYGATVSLNELNVDEPSGQEADWVSLTLQVLMYGPLIVLKTLYMLTVRGRENQRSHKGARIQYKDSSSVLEDEDGNKTEHNIFISHATEQSSIKRDEFTPGRFKTCAGGVFVANVMTSRLISPVMGVIGFKKLVENWGVRSIEFMHRIIPGKEEEISEFDGKAFLIKQAELRDAGPLKSVAFTNKYIGYSFYDRGTVGAYLMRKADRAWSAANNTWNELRGNITEKAKVLVWKLDDDIAPWCFACGPDRCPPACITVPGVPELGGFLAILQDVRNTIIASKLMGTAEEKARKQSTFFVSYSRRTQAMGITLDNVILKEMVQAWGNEMVKSFNLGGDIDEDIRKLCQGMIDEQVKLLSNNVPLKL